MRHIVSCVALVVLAASAAAEDVQLKYTQPSRVIALLLQGEVWSSPLSKTGSARVGSLEGTGQGLVPKGVKLVARDAKGILSIEGTAAQIVEIRRFVELFDVRPAKVEVRVQIDCPILNHSTKTTSTVVNNRGWTTSDGVTDLKVSIAPRINDDGTVTFFISTARSGFERTLVARAKPDQAIHLRLTKSLSFKVAANGDKVDWKGFVEDTDESALGDPAAMIRIEFSVQPGEPTENDPPQPKGGI